jgi:16S rRNA (cytidine1402-2'-O)-methyltransferase
VSGALVLIATPIGNLADLSPRAVQELGRADAIACEDTRRARKLLSHAGVPVPDLVVVNDHTEAAAANAVLARLDAGQRVAVITDAGMPGVSDPGERLVRAAIGQGIDVEVVPGPSAAISALVVSGLATGRWVFEGFLPRRGSGRTERLAALAGERRTMVLFEAPHRLARTLADLATVVEPTRELVLVREQTKLHEEVWRGSLDGAIARTEAEPPRGEHVLVIAGAPAAEAGDDDLRAALDRAIADGATTRDAVAEVASAFAVSRRRVYDLATRTTNQ